MSDIKDIERNAGMITLDEYRELKRRWGAKTLDAEKYGKRMHITYELESAQEFIERVSAASVPFDENQWVEIGPNDPLSIGDRVLVSLLGGAFYRDGEISDIDDSEYPIGVRFSETVGCRWEREKIVYRSAQEGQSHDRH